MSSTPEDVALRISPQGLEDVSAAFKKILGDINRTGRDGAKAFGPLKSIASDLKSLLPAIGIAAVVTGLTSLTRTALEAADAAGKTAIKFGTTSETITTLQFAAKTANVENSQLEVGLTQLTKSLGELNAETKQQVDAFGLLGLKAQSFRGKDIGESFALVADRMSKIPDSAVKTRTALDIFGKQAVDLIPLLNDLGSKGFGAVRAEAERFGLVVDSQTAAAAAAVNDSFTLIGAQVRGLATQFLSGLAPVIATVMEDFRNDVAGTGVTAAEDFGIGVGKAIRDVIEFFQVGGKSIALFIANTSDAIGNFVEKWANSVTGNFKELDKLDTAYLARKKAREDAYTEDLDNIMAKRAASEDRERKLREDAGAKAKERAALLQQLQDLETQQATEKKRKEEQDQANKDAAKAELERAKAEEESAKTVLDLNQQLLKSRGQNREAAILELDQGLAKQREVISAAGQLNSETEALLAKVRQFGVIQIDFSALSSKVNDEFASFERAREQIESDVQAGVESQVGGERRLIELEKSRLPILQSLVAELQKQALLSGDPELIAKAEQLAVGVREIATSLEGATNIGARFRTAGLDAFESGISDILNNLEKFDSVKDVFRSLASTVADSLRRMASEMIAAAIRAQALKLILNSFGGGGASAGGSAASGFAGGGYVQGPGTPTSDSITARLSAGEFVTRAAAVQVPGALPFLSYLNRNLKMPDRVPRFAQGGLVSPSSGGSSPSQGGSRFRIINQLDSSLIHESMASPGGEEVIINVIEKNSSRLGRMFGGR